MNKVLLISIDGLRSDGLKACGNPYVEELEKLCTYTYDGASLYPPVTLPCHYSMAYSVAPEEHGIMDNTFVCNDRSRKGIFEAVKDAGGRCAIFYGWEELRDIARPSAMKYSVYIDAFAHESVDTILTDKAEELIEAQKPELVFLYMVDTDDKGGHHNGWMSEEYLRRASMAIDNVRRMIEKFGDEYTVVIMSDHGGHDNWHGSNIPEDMVVPFFICGKDFEGGAQLESMSLLDIAPTIADIMGIAPEENWKGRSLKG